MKKIRKILSVLMLMAVSVTCVFALEPPKMQCLTLLNNNQSLRVNWSYTSDCEKYNVFHFYVNGVPVMDYTVSAPYNFCNYGGIVISNLPAADTYYCWIVAEDSAGVSVSSDTIKSINLTVTAISNNEKAELVWEAPTSNLDATWDDVYKLFKRRSHEPDFPATPFATVPKTNNTYIDISNVCGDNVFYQVSIGNKYDIQNPCSFMTKIDSAFLSDGKEPLAPTLDSVSVTPTNEVILGFHENELQMMGYVIYYKTQAGFEPYDTVFNQTFWLDPNFDPSNGIRHYRIAALDSCWNSSPQIDAQTEMQCNMLLKVNDMDACYKKASISWSKYENMPGGLDGYEIFLSADSGQNWVSQGTTNTTSFTLENLQLNTDYLVYILAKNAAGSITSKSNRANFLITSGVSNDFSYISSVSVVEDNHLEISVLTSGDTLPFVFITLQRSEDGAVFENFATLSHQNGTAEYLFEDNSAKFERRVYYYRAYLTDNCGTNTAFSNVSHNILLTGEALAQTNILSWNSYEGWNGGVSDYMIMRNLESEEGFNAIAQEPPATVNVFQDDVAQHYESGSRFVYYVIAGEVPNQYGVQGKSVSNTLVLVQNPTIYIPGAFRPNGAVNNVFRPVNSFVSKKDYRFEIYTRTGNLVFMSIDPQGGWDGCMGGKILPVGVYVYRLQYRTHDNTLMERTGTVTLFR